jgi:hypothetical protein
MCGAGVTAGRVPDRDVVGGNDPRYDRVRADNGSVADVCTTEDSGTTPDPHVMSDSDWPS